MAHALAASPDNLGRYLAEVRRHPLLDRDEETRLAVALREHNDAGAAHRLVVANLRFVVRVAQAYRGYGLRMLDLIQEGNVGLMMAVKKFDPSRGYRLITYAVWWIRAAMQSFIMRSWSLVRMGASRMQRKLFFRLRAERAKAAQAGQGAAVTAEELALRLGASAQEVDEVAQRLAARDFSLDAPHVDSAENTYLDGVAAPEPGPDAQLEAAQERQLLRDRAAQAAATLTPQERAVLQRRLLAEEPESLQEIGNTFALSRERIRQLEVRVVDRLRTAYGQSRKRRRSSRLAAGEPAQCPVAPAVTGELSQATTAA